MFSFSSSSSATAVSSEVPFAFELHPTVAVDASAALLGSFNALDSFSPAPESTAMLQLSPVLEPKQSEERAPTSQTELKAATQRAEPSKALKEDAQCARLMNTTREDSSSEDSAARLMKLDLVRVRSLCLMVAVS